MRTISFTPVGTRILGKTVIKADTALACGHTKSCYPKSQFPSSLLHFSHRNDLPEGNIFILLSILNERKDKILFKLDAFFLLPITEMPDT